MQPPACEEVEHRNDEDHVNPTDDFPSERHKFFEVELFSLWLVCIVSLKRIIVIRAKIEAETGGLGAGNIERDVRPGLVFLDITGVL